MLMCLLVSRHSRGKEVKSAIYALVIRYLQWIKISNLKPLSALDEPAAAATYSAFLFPAFGVFDLAAARSDSCRYPAPDIDTIFLYSRWNDIKALILVLYGAEDVSPRHPKSTLS